jgi:hypothetical protein
VKIARFSKTFDLLGKTFGLIELLILPGENEGSTEPLILPGKNTMV